MSGFGQTNAAIPLVAAGREAASLLAAILFNQPPIAVPTSDWKHIFAMVV